MTRMTQQPVVVIGTGLAGWTTVREFRKLDAATPVTLVTADSGDFYAKPSLSNAFAQGRSPAQLVTTPAAKMVQAQNVALMAHTKVEALDTQAQTITTSEGLLGYSRVVLATGARPIRVPLSGTGAGDVLSVNSLDDFAQMHGRLRPGAHVVIMGAGLIGCEFANDLRSAGYLVNVVDPGPRPLASLLPEAASHALQEALAALGVRWHFGTTVQTVHRDAGGNWVGLANGEWMPADLVLSAVGLNADTTLAQAAGLACARGIVVDAALQTSAANAYALGDCAQYASAGQRTLPFVMPIMSAARALAATLAGQRTEVQFPVMPVAVKTPAQPIVVAPPAPGQQGTWQAGEPGIWQFVCERALPRGFVLTGAQTSKRAEMARLLAN
ncbi:MAG TPA: FAD-dependent oxidoreductase [Burkholderiaceae bacterium]|nr:FAD-dependent oxidoreductase [Burkholderiaceae bacterium]